MSFGVIMLVHTDFDRAAQLVRHWSDAGCPVIVHVDSNVVEAVYDQFSASLADLTDVRFCARHRCEWGTWGMVAASQEAATMLLDEFPNVGHVYLASGACLPLRPVTELQTYLEAHQQTDFIESATTSDVPWTIGGLDRERFTLRFPLLGRNIAGCLIALSNCSNCWGIGGPSLTGLSHIWDHSGGV